MDTLWQMLTNTPWWVYILLIYLLRVGILACKTRTVSLKRLFIIPAVLTLMTLHTFFATVKVDAFVMMVGFSALTVGIILGYLQISHSKLIIDKEKSSIQIPGSYITLLLILIIFTSKYYFGYELAIDPQLINQSWFEFSLLSVSGLCAGFFIGKLICYLYRFNSATHVEQEVKP